MSRAIKLFEGASHAAEYAQFRPTYSKSILNILLDYVSQRGGGCNHAVDVACGSGQSTFYLGHHFRECVGLDISPQQIKQAQLRLRESKSVNVRFEVADARSLPLEDSSADLVTIATAWHYNYCEALR